MAEQFQYTEQKEIYFLEDESPQHISTEISEPELSSAFLSRLVASDQALLLPFKLALPSSIPLSLVRVWRELGIPSCLLLCVTPALRTLPMEATGLDKCLSPDRTPCSN